MMHESSPVCTVLNEEGDEGEKGAEGGGLARTSGLRGLTTFCNLGVAWFALGVCHLWEGQGVVM